MKRFFLCILAGIIFIIPQICTAQTPDQIGGFMLGASLDSYKDRLLPDTDLPMRYRSYIHEIQTTKTPGFKSGLITYGNCVAPGTIFRIKLKYEDTSKDFYETLLKKFKKKFGSPDEWIGDSFHIVTGWKWSFKGKNGKCSVILQHNLLDADETKGNSVKLTSYDLGKKERKCYLKKNPPKSVNKQEEKQETIDWDMMIPR